MPADTSRACAHTPAIVAACWVLLLGCAAGATGDFERTAYRHATYDLAVAYANAATQSLLGTDWLLDNYYWKYGALVPKTGADYQATYYVDTDGDGDADDIGNRLIYDLRFIHKRRSGVIWLRTIPLQQKFAATEPVVLAREFIDAMAGTHYETVQLQGKLVQLGQQRTYAIEVLDDAVGTIGAYPAFRVNLHVVDVDQHDVAPDARRYKVQLVTVKAPFRFTQTFRDQIEYSLPVVMLVGYAAHADDFDAALPEFEAFLRRLTIAGKSGVDFRAPAPAPATATAPRPDSL